MKLEIEGDDAVKLFTALYAASQHLTNRDLSNAWLHLAPIRLSPLTQEIGTAVMWLKEEMIKAGFQEGDLLAKPRMIIKPNGEKP